MKLYVVPVSLVAELWPVVAPLLSKAIKHHPYMATDDALAILLAGRGDLILALDEGRVLCAAIMEAIQYPNEKVGNVLALAGERGVYREHMSEITDYLEQWSRKHGCHKIGMVGRPGWLKFVRHRGWETQRCLSASKELSPA